MLLPNCPRRLPVELLLALALGAAVASCDGTVFHLDCSRDSCVTGARCCGGLTCVGGQCLPSASSLDGGALPTRLVILPGSATLEAGTCKGFVVEAKDGRGVRYSLSVPIALSASSDQGQFFSELTCSKALSKVQMAAGETSAPFWYRELRSGAVELVAAAEGLTPGRSALACKPRPASQLVILGSQVRTLKGQCSQPVDVETRDDLGNPSPLAQTTVVALNAPQDTEVYGNGTCSNNALSSQVLPAGASRASFSYRAWSIGYLQLTATSDAGLGTGRRVDEVTDTACASAGTGSCDSSSECCGGSVCHQPADGGVGTCCQQSNGSCKASSECCSGQCVNGVCAGSCEGTGLFCAGDSSCCSGLSCQLPTFGTAGQCCSPTAGACRADLDCCSGWCGGGLCQPESCPRSGSPCL
jgi:hypothetical protein